MTRNDNFSTFRRLGSGECFFELTKAFILKTEKWKHLTSVKDVRAIAWITENIFYLCFDNRMKKYQNTKTFFFCYLSSLLDSNILIERKSYKTLQVSEEVCFSFGRVRMICYMLWALLDCSCSSKQWSSSSLCRISCNLKPALSWKKKPKRSCPSGVQKRKFLIASCVKLEVKADDSSFK